MKIKSLDEIQKLEFIGSGTFGTVYRKGDTKYKLFHKEIKITGGWIAKNPSLKPHFFKNHLLIYRSKGVKHTDLITDTIYLDRVFVGTISKFSEGVTLDKVRSKLPFYSKVFLIHDLVHNVEELMSNSIYPLDLSFCNVVYDEKKADRDRVHIIDLDDIQTKVKLLPSDRLQKKSYNELKNVIISFFTNDQYYNLTQDILDELEAYNIRIHYYDINDFNKTFELLGELDKKRSLFFIDIDDINERSIKDIIIQKQESDIDIVLVSKNADIDCIREVLSLLSKYKIKLFDIHIGSFDNIESFICNYNIDNYFLYNNGIISYISTDFNKMQKKYTK